MPNIQMNQFHLNMANAIFNYQGATGEMDSFTGTMASAVGNGMGVCLDMIEAARAGGPPASKSAVAASVFKVCGPLLGLTESEYVNLAVAFALVGLSTVGLAAALAPLTVAGAVASPALIALGALGLLGDAVGLGAAQGGLELRIRKQLANRGRRLSAKQIEMIVDQYYRRRPASYRYI